MIFSLARAIRKDVKGQRSATSIKIYSDPISSVVEGNMCGTAMRGADAPPGSKATSRMKGLHRNLGGLGSDRLALCRTGPRREGEEP